MLYIYIYIWWAFGQGMLASYDFMNVRRRDRHLKSAAIIELYIHTVNSSFESNHFSSLVARHRLVHVYTHCTLNREYPVNSLVSYIISFVCTLNINQTRNVISCAHIHIILIYYIHLLQKHTQYIILSIFNFVSII